MSDYDLGTAHGEIKIDYDKSGFAAARKDIEDFNKDGAALQNTLSDLDKSFADFSKNLKTSLTDAKKSIADFSKDFDNALGGGGANKKITVEVNTQVDSRTMEQAIADASRRMRAIIVPVEIDRNKFAEEIAKLNASNREKETVKLKVKIDEAISSGALKNEFAIVRILDSISDAFDNVFAAGGKALSGIGGFAGEAASELGSVAKGVAGLIGPFAILFGILGAGVGIMDLLVAAGGAVTTALLAVPAAIGLFGPAFAAVKLGMDGIKAAAKTIQPEFDKMQKSVSETFKTGLTPVFKELATIFPQLTVGLNGTASSLVAIAQALVDVVTSKTGLATLSQIIGNANSALRQMAPNLAGILATFLRLASVPAAMQLIVDAVDQLNTSFEQTVATLDNNGTLAKAFQGLDSVIQSAIRAVFATIENLTTAFSTAAPGIASFVDSLTAMFKKVNWAAVGKSVGDTFKGIGDALKNIPQGTIDSIVQGFQGIADVFKSDEFKTFASNLASEIPPLLGQLKSLLQGIIEVYNKAQEIFNWAKSNGLTGDGPTENTGFAKAVSPPDQKWSKPGDPTIFTPMNEWLKSIGKSIDDWFASSGLTDSLHKIGDAIANYFTTTLPQQLSSINLSTILSALFVSGGSTSFDMSWLDGIGTSIKNWFTTTLPGMLTGINWVQLLAGVFTGGTSWASLIVQWLTPLATDIKNWFTTTLPGMLTGIQWVQLLAGVFTGGTSWTGLVAGWLGGLATEIKNWFTTTLPTLLKGIDFMAILKAALSGTAAGGSGLIGGLGGGSSVGTLSADQMAGLGIGGSSDSGGGDIAAQITAQLQPALTAIQAFGTQAAAAMSTAMIQVNNAIITSLGQLGPIITAQFTTLAPTITAAFAALGPQIMTALSAALTAAFATLGPTLAIQINNAFVQAFTTAFATLGPVLGVQISTSLAGAFTTAFATLGPTLAIQVNNAFTTSFATLATTLTPVVNTTITTAFAGVGPAITAALSGIGATITAAFTGAFAGVAGAVTTAMNSANQAASNGVKTIQTTITNGLNQMKTAIKPDDWKAVGEGIVAGIQAGIAAGWPALEQYVQQLAMQLLAAALGALGIASPSKEFFWVGQMMMKGWMNGIADGAGGVFKAVGGILAWIFGAVGGGWHWPGSGGGPTTPPPPTEPPPPPPPPSTGVGWNPKVRPTGATRAADPFMTGPISVTIDAKTVAEMNTVVDFFNGVQQTARAGGSR